MFTHGSALSGNAAASAASGHPSAVDTRRTHPSDDTTATESFASLLMSLDQLPTQHHTAKGNVPSHTPSKVTANTGGVRTNTSVGTGKVQTRSASPQVNVPNWKAGTQHVGGFSSPSPRTSSITNPSTSPSLHGPSPGFERNSVVQAPTRADPSLAKSAIEHTRPNQTAVHAVTTEDTDVTRQAGPTVPVIRDSPKAVPFSPRSSLAKDLIGFDSIEATQSVNALSPAVTSVQDRSRGPMMLVTKPPMVKDGIAVESTVSQSPARASIQTGHSKPAPDKPGVNVSSEGRPLRQRVTDRAPDFNGVAVPSNASPSQPLPPTASTVAPTLNTLQSDWQTQLSALVRGRIDGNVPNTWRINVHPEGMGQLTISVAKQSDGIHIHLEGTTAATVDLLSQHTSSLTDALRDKGIDLTDLQVSYRSASGGPFQDFTGQSFQSNHQQDDARALQPFSRASRVTGNAAPYPMSETTDLGLSDQISIQV